MSSLKLPEDVGLSSRQSLRFDIPIAQRLTLGFLIAALIAGIVAGGIGIQRVESLHEQSDFYQNLLQAETTLTVEANLLELMNIQTHELLKEPFYSDETLQNGLQTLRNLETSYTTHLRDYIKLNLLSQHPELMNLLNASNSGNLVQRQRGLVSSALRTWSFCQQPLMQILDRLAHNDWAAALTIERLQGEPTSADAESALSALLQFNEHLAHTIGNSVVVEEQFQLLVTIVGIILAVLSIALVGIFISNTLVNRLKQLRRVTRSVEAGLVNDRVEVIGRDEIADISASVNAMLEIIAAEQEIITASELKDQFIASVSHELRNPLTEVYGWLEILTEFGADQDYSTQQECLKKAMHGCQELMLLTSNVLDATHVGEQGKAPLLEAVTISEMVHSILEHMDPRETDRYDLRVEADATLAVWADPQYLRQVLRNLLSNAMKYAPRQTTITIRACRRIEEESRTICVCVDDNGPGIPPEEIALLFHKFARLPRDKARGIRGSGLGLYICKQFIETMNGQIWVESSGVEGEGSCFCLTLPEAISGYGKYTAMIQSSHLSMNV